MILPDASRCERRLHLNFLNRRPEYGPYGPVRTFDLKIRRILAKHHRKGGRCLRLPRLCMPIKNATNPVARSSFCRQKVLLLRIVLIYFTPRLSISDNSFAATTGLSVYIKNILSCLWKNPLHICLCCLSATWRRIEPLQWRKHFVLLFIYQTFCPKTMLQIMKSIYPTLRNKGLRFFYRRLR